MHRLNATENAILRGIRADRERLSRGVVPSDLRGIPRGRMLLAVDAARDEGFIKLNTTSWLGHQPTRMESQAIYRGLRRLTAKGLIERVMGAFGERTAAVKLTAAGEVAATVATPETAVTCGV